MFWVGGNGWRGGGYVISIECSFCVRERERESGPTHYFAHTAPPNSPPNITHPPTAPPHSHSAPRVTKNWRFFSIILPGHDHEKTLIIKITVIIIITTIIGITEIVEIIVIIEITKIIGITLIIGIIGTVEIYVSSEIIEITYLLLKSLKISKMNVFTNNSFVCIP